MSAEFFKLAIPLTFVSFAQLFQLLSNTSHFARSHLLPNAPLALSTVKFGCQRRLSGRPRPRLLFLQHEEMERLLARGERSRRQEGEGGVFKYPQRSPNSSVYIGLAVHYDYLDLNCEKQGYQESFQKFFLALYLGLYCLVQVWYQVYGPVQCKDIANLAPSKPYQGIL
ncbi:hypothetical protein GW17_00013721 [Ensete ventricosum]|nr:hypothetical protein GW17_00013721 [Ensete ventricosum]